MALASGRSKNCATKCGAGIEKLALLNFADLTTFTTAAGNGSVSAITVTDPAVAYEFISDDNSVEFRENGSQSGAQGFKWEQEIGGTWSCRNLVDRNIIQSLAEAGCGFIVFWLEGTGVTWMAGVKPGDPLVQKYAIHLKTTTGKTGATLDDSNDTAWVLGAVSLYQAMVFTPGWAGVPLS